MRRTALLALVIFLTGTTAFAGGFQVAAQGARAMGMGLAYTAVADDASAIFYNPAGLALRGDDDPRAEILLGGMVATNLEGTFESAVGVEEQRRSLSALPQAYASWRHGRLALGVGAYTPFGLPMRWEDPDTFSGRFVSQTALLRTIDINPTIAWQVTPNLAVGAGWNYVSSKVQLERNSRGPAGTPLASFEVAHTRLSSEQLDNSGSGWNAGVLWRTSIATFGASYRSGIEVDHEGIADTTQILTGNPAIDNAVRAVLPGRQDARVSIDYPSSLNFGVAFDFGATTLAFDADRTNWSSFEELDVFLGGVRQIHRDANWEDAWAWRAGIERQNCIGAVTCRAGYYRDETPQPLFDVGPVLPDADRQGFAIGVGIPLGGRLALELANIFILFDERTTSAGNHDALFGTYETRANEFAFNLRWR